MHAPSEDRNPPPLVYTQGVTPAPVAGALRNRRRADVAVIGAGFTGLSAALHLAQGGADVVVLEAKSVGWGASGRAFGQVVPYLKHDQDAIIAHYGAADGERLIEAVAAGPDLVFGLIEQHRIACNLVRTGLIFASHAPAGRRALEARTLFWQRRGAPVRMLDAAETEATIGSRVYQACSLDERGGHLNPFAYATGLARAAIVAGVTIHTDSAVRALERAGGRWLVRTDGGAIDAGAVIIGTNAYTDGLWPGLRESIVPMRGHALVSRPLSDNVRRAILPGRQSMTDTRRLFSGIRLLPDGRLHASGDGPAFGQEAGPYQQRIAARVARLFPFLGELQWEQSWSGWVAMTEDQFPRMHELAPGVFAGLGYSGRGIAAATMMGRDLAVLASGQGKTVFPLSPLRPIRGRRLAPWMIRALLHWYRFRDLTETR